MAGDLQQQEEELKKFDEVAQLQQQSYLTAPRSCEPISIYCSQDLIKNTY